MFSVGQLQRDGADAFADFSEMHGHGFDVDGRQRQGERWLLASGETVLAALPKGVGGHFGANLKRFVLNQYHQGQVTIPRLTAQLAGLGVGISKRQIVRILTSKQGAFVKESLEVLRAGLSSASWLTVDDTGARHKARNGFCTHIGNDCFAFFATTGSKSRLNFLELLRAGKDEYVINDAALAYMREHKLPQATIAHFGNAEQRFADRKAFMAHLQTLGLMDLKVKPDPFQIATEAALWGSIVEQGLLDGVVIVSDGAGQFKIAEHALCWVHAERLIHKLDTFCAAHVQAKERIRARIWRLYKDLKAYRQAPTRRRARQLERRFDAIFSTETGFATLDRLLARLRAQKTELLMVLKRPEIPLHTNGSENDIRCQVTRRKISAGTRSDEGRDARDAFLGLMKTCAKLAISFWDYLGDRLGAPEAPVDPEQVLQEFGQPVLGNEMTGPQIDGHRRNPAAIVHGRRHALWKIGLALRAARPDGIGGKFPDIKLHGPLRRRTHARDAPSRSAPAVRASP